MKKQKNVEPDTVAQQNVPQKKKDIKIAIRNLLVLVLVAAVSIVGTLAFLADNSLKRTNTFTGSAGIEVTLKEDKWTSTSADNPVKGEDLAKNYTPEMPIPKNPTLKNTSASECEEWVAIRVDYTFAGSETTRAILETKVIETIAMNTGATGDWYKLDTRLGADADAATTNYEIYLYKTRIKKTASDGEETDPLFEKIVIKKQTDIAADVYDDQEKKYKEFKIIVCGAAIKHDASITSGITTISDITSYPINMSGLSNQLATVEADSPATPDAKIEKDSKRIALALAALLQDVSAIGEAS